MNLTELDQKISEVEGLLRGLKEARESLPSNGGRLEHTYYYFRNDRNYYEVHWVNKPYVNKYIASCETQEEAEAISRKHNDIANFVLESHGVKKLL